MHTKDTDILALPIQAHLYERKRKIIIKQVQKWRANKDDYKNSEEVCTAQWQRIMSDLYLHKAELLINAYCMFSAQIAEYNCSFIVFKLI